MTSKGAAKPVTAAARRRVDRIYEADPDGRPVVHERVVNSLDLMLRRGVITDPMWHAGRHFQRDFHLARLDVMPLPKLVRMPGDGGGVDDLTASQVDARRRLARAMTALGGLASPGGRCVWAVVGEERSLREFVRRQCWGGRPIHWFAAQGMLIAALAMLAVHYKYERA